jgi:N-acetyl-anhydromuramyl-L-alanine amidase AmpD
MADDVVDDVADADLSTEVGDLKFEGFDVTDATKKANGRWTLKIKKAESAVAPAPDVQSVRVPAEWMPDCKMDRIICHWTAGPYTASDHDQECYHILIEGNGKLVRGEHTIDDNVNTGDDDYAAHTRRCNTGSIGISVCCMANANEAPFRAGPCPMTRQQWEFLAQVAAQLAKRYNIPVTPKTVLGHGEVQQILGIPQLQKWDPMVLPWDTSVSKQDVGNRFRARVSQLLVSV